MRLADVVPADALERKVESISDLPVASAGAVDGLLTADLVRERQRYQPARVKAGAQASAQGRSAGSPFDGPAGAIAFDLLALVKELTGRGVTCEFVKENLIFTGDDSPASKLMLAVFGGAAEFERDMIRERQREGIAAARAAGKHLGRAAILKSREVKELQKRVKAGEDKAAIAKAFGISRASVYNYAAS